MINFPKMSAKESDKKKKTVNQKTFNPVLRASSCCGKPATCWEGGENQGVANKAGAHL